MLETLACRPSQVLEEVVGALEEVRGTRIEAEAASTVVEERVGIALEDLVETGAAAAAAAAVVVVPAAVIPSPPKMWRAQKAGELPLWRVGGMESRHSRILLNSERQPTDKRQWAVSLKAGTREAEEGEQKMVLATTVNKPWSRFGMRSPREAQTVNGRADGEEQREEESFSAQICECKDKMDGEGEGEANDIHWAPFPCDVHLVRRIRSSGQFVVVILSPQTFSLSLPASPPLPDLTSVRAMNLGHESGAYLPT
nr:hypothetical protein CFP56_76407 [Quercus suber]